MQMRNFVFLIGPIRLETVIDGKHGLIHEYMTSKEGASDASFFPISLPADLKLEGYPSVECIAQTLGIGEAACEGWSINDDSSSVLIEIREGQIYQWHGPSR